MSERRALPPPMPWRRCRRLRIQWPPDLARTCMQICISLHSLRFPAAPHLLIVRTSPISALHSLLARGPWAEEVLPPYAAFRRVVKPKLGSRLVVHELVVPLPLGTLIHSGLAPALIACSLSGLLFLVSSFSVAMP